MPAAMDKVRGSAGARLRPRDIPVRIITAIAADDLVLVGVAALRAALYDAGRPPSQDHRPATPGLDLVIHACPPVRFPRGGDIDLGHRPMVAFGPSYGASARGLHMAC